MANDVVAVKVRVVVLVPVPLVVAVVPVAEPPASKLALASNDALVVPAVCKFKMLPVPEFETTRASSAPVLSCSTLSTKVESVPAELGLLKISESSLAVKSILVSEPSTSALYEACSVVAEPEQLAKVSRQIVSLAVMAGTVMS